MSTHSNYSRMTIDMSALEHKRLKAMAAYMGISLKKLVLSCLRKHLLSKHEPNLNKNEPNEETLHAFKETENGTDLIECNDFDDFIEKLEIENA